MKPRDTLIITGAAGGLGQALAQEFTKDQDIPLSAIFTVRDFESKGVYQLQQIIRDDSRCQVRPLQLHNLLSVRNFALEVNAQVSSGQLEPIAVLCLNAGYMSSHG